MDKGMKSRMKKASVFDIDEVLKDMNQHYMDPERESSVADKFYVTPSYFARRFKKETGLTWHDYRNRRRISLAFEPLLLSSAPIEEIARKCGFANRRSFTAAFTRQCGVTPSTFRRRALAEGGFPADSRSGHLGRFRMPKRS